MFTITKLKMWKDPGYTRQCLEVPPPGSWKLPAPDYTSSEDLRPRRGSTLSQIELPLSYIEIFDMSYLYIEAKDSATPTPHTISVFGWILGIEESASSNDAVRITWTPDYWRTYSGSATFGKCTITRCNNATYKRPYAKHPRKWKIAKMNAFDPTPESLWCCVIFNKTSGGVTSVERRCWQMGKILTSGGVDYKGISVTDVMMGKIDEAMQISASAITGVFITPYQPHAGTINYVDSVLGKIWYWEGYGSATTYGTWDPNDAYFTDDMNEAVIVDPYGAIVGRIPYGVKVTSWKLYTDIGTSDLRSMLCLGDANDATDAEKSGPLGRVISLSPLTAPVNNNAYGEYVYSGQRDYDKKNAELQRNETRLKGYINSGESMIGAGVAGSLAGGPLGLVGGLVAGTGLNIASNELNYNIQGKLNDKYQKMTDDLYSNQTSNLLISGGGMGFTNMLNQWYWVQLTADDTSKAEYTADVTINGYETNIPVSNPNSFLTAGGPLQIQNLVITGAIPPEAKTYIKNILSNGVRIVENNPAGVNP